MSDAVVGEGAAVMSSRPPSLREEFAELWSRRELLRQMVTRELKVRYKNSVLGVLWSIVPPLLQVIIYSFFLRGILSIQVPNYYAYLLCGIIPWAFFSTTIQEASSSILFNYVIIKKVYLPREIMPLSCVISNFIHFLVGWGVFFTAFLLVAPRVGGGIPLRPEMAWFPLILVMELLLVTGLSLWVAALNVFYEDVKFIVSTLFQMAFFVLPVLVPADPVKYVSVFRAYPWLYKLYMLNPITAVIEGFRKTLLAPLRPEEFNKQLLGQGLPAETMQWDTFAGAFVLTLLILWSGYAYFNRRKWQFVERP